jgi:hypothetical protein
MIRDATQQHVGQVVNDAINQFSGQLGKLTAALEEVSPNVSRAIHQGNQLASQNNGNMTLGAVNGQLQRLPVDWRWPKGGAFQLWQEWNLGDTARNVPALRLLNVKAFNFLDSIPLSEEEKRGRRGRNVSKRRQARRTYGDMRKLCNLITAKASAAGLATSDHTPTNVRWMFEVAASEFKELQARNKRGQEQGAWATIVSKLYKKTKKDKDTRSSITT